MAEKLQEDVAAKFSAFGYAEQVEAFISVDSNILKGAFERSVCNKQVAVTFKKYKTTERPMSWINSIWRNMKLWKTTNSLKGLYRLTK